MDVWMCLGTDDRYKSCQSWHKSCIARSLGIECIYPLYQDSCFFFRMSRRRDLGQFCKSTIQL